MKKLIILFLVLTTILVGCNNDSFVWDLIKVDRLATISTITAINITNTGVTVNSVIEYDGGSTVTQRGVCWGSNQNPTITDNFNTNGSGSGSFTSSISGLNSNTTYYVRAYATNGVGTSYGNQINFTTTNISGSLPTLTTVSVSNVTNNSAVSGVNITSDGGSTVTQRGVCWSTNQNPTITDNITINGSGSGSFISSISGLNSNSTYYVRGYATNGVGTSYGNQINFTTTNISGSLPTLTTVSVSNVTYNSAVSGGNITSDGGSTVTQRGVCWSTNQNPTIADNIKNNGAGIGTFSSSITSLNANTTYYVRSYATNGLGIAYGNQVNFMTSMPTPLLVGSNNCASLIGITSSYTYWNGTSHANTAWSISTNGYIGSCWAADMSGLSGTGPVGSHYIQFSKNFSNNGFIKLWLNTYNPGYNNVFPVIYIDGVAQTAPIMTGGQTSSFYFMQIQSSVISAGSHTIKIEFNCNYRDIYVDEIEFYEY